MADLICFFRVKFLNLHIRQRGLDNAYATKYNFWGRRIRFLLVTPLRLHLYIHIDRILET